MNIDKEYIERMDEAGLRGAAAGRKLAKMLGELVGRAKDMGLSITETVQIINTDEVIANKVARQCGGTEEELRVALGRLIDGEDFKCYDEAAPVSREVYDTLEGRLQKRAEMVRVMTVNGAEMKLTDDELKE